jgi:hypothetical protein
MMLTRPDNPPPRQLFEALKPRIARTVVSYYRLSTRRQRADSRNLFGALAGGTFSAAQEVSELGLADAGRKHEVTKEVKDHEGGTRLKGEG